jgi:hypothetical protein
VFNLWVIESSDERLRILRRTGWRYQSESDSGERQSIMPVGAVQVTACMSGSATLIERLRDVELRKESAKSPGIPPLRRLTGIAALGQSAAAC